MHVREAYTAYIYVSLYSKFNRVGEKKMWMMIMSELDHVTYVLSQPMLALGSCKREHKVPAVIW